jgi:uncharacterized protein YhdP
MRSHVLPSPLDHKAKSCAPAPAEIAGEVCGSELDYDLAAHR